MISTKARALAIGALALGVVFAGSPAAAQTWTAQPASENWDAAAVAQWDSGLAMAARCQRSDFRLIIPLVSPLEGMAATVSYAFDGEDVRSELSALASGGRAVFARVPADFARQLMMAQSLDMTVSDGKSPPQRFILETPYAPEVLGEVLTACGEPLVVTPYPPGTIITNPDWIQRPEGIDLARYYPDRALRMSTNGTATIECIVAANGRLRDCLPVSEEPEGEGFGIATIAAAQQYRMRPQLADGQPIEGARVTLTIAWRAP